MQDFYDLLISEGRKSDYVFRGFFRPAYRAHEVRVLAEAVFHEAFQLGVGHAVRDHVDNAAELHFKVYVMAWQFSQTPSGSNQTIRVNISSSSRPAARPLPLLSFDDLLIPEGRKTLNQHDTKDIPAHQAEHADLNLRPKAEIKSRRVALLMKESIYKQLKGKARSQARSVNDLVNALVEAYLSQGGNNHEETNRNHCRDDSVFERSVIRRRKFIHRKIRGRIKGRSNS